jgi:phosphatidylserine/phosphatidylglycerophosphate/cardiolipin synthase-like enzyme
MAYELAQMVDKKDAIDQIEVGIIRAFNGASGVARGYDITREVSPLLSSGLHRALLTALKGAKVLTVIKAAPHIEGGLYTLDHQRLAAYMAQQRVASDVISELIGQRKNETPSSVRVVATLPGDWERIEGIDPTDESIRRIIIGAQESLWIVSPFFDDFGKTAIEEALLARALRGVRIKVVGRQLSPSDTQRNKRSIESLQMMATKFKDQGLSSNFDIREFTQRDQITKATSAGLHSKIVIADDSICYLGSANMTEWSLSRNFELGVILKGPQLMAICGLIEKLWDDSTPFALMQ